MTFKKISIKQVQHFWDARPCNVRHSLSPVGTRKYFDEVDKRRYFVEPHILDFAQFPKWKNKKVLEIGCGIGTDTIRFAKAGAQVTAIEISQKSLDLAKRRAKVCHLDKKIKFYLGDAEKLSKVVPVKPYDLIYSFGVIHHTPHPEKTIAELKKYTSKNTTIKIMVYHRYSWKVLWILLKFGKGAFWKIDKLIADHSEAATGSPVSYVYSKSQTSRLLKGLRVKDIKIDFIFPYSIPEYIKHKYKIVWYFRYLPSSLWNWFKSHFGWHILVTARA